MPPTRGRGRGGGLSGSGPSDSKPAAALRRIMRQRQPPSVKASSKSKATEGASESVPRSVSSSSAQSTTEVGSDSDSDSSYYSCIDSFGIDSVDSDDSDSQISDSDSDDSDSQISDSDSDDSDDSDSQISDSDDSDSGFEPIASDSLTGAYDPYEREMLLSAIAKSLPYHGIMLLLFEAPYGFVLCTFPGAYCYLPDSVDDIWAEFGNPLHATFMVFPKGFRSFEDKSRAINAVTGVDSKLADLIKKWHKPGMKMCVGKPEYKTIIESVLKIPCLICSPVMEIMWGLQQQLHSLMPREKPTLTKEDRLPMSQGLMRFLRNCGFDIKPEMVNEKIFLTACALFHCDVDDKKNLRILGNARLNIRCIYGIACEDWDILKLALAVKVIRCPEELTDFHEVLAKYVVSKLKGDARKYEIFPYRITWFRASDEVVSSHHLRIEKKKMLESLVKKAKKAYEAEQAKVDKAKLDGELESTHNPNHLYPTNLVGEVLRRSPRLNPNM